MGRDEYNFGLLLTYVLTLIHANYKRINCWALRFMMKSWAYSGSSLSLVSGAQIRATIPSMYTQAIRLAPSRKLRVVDK